MPVPRQQSELEKQKQFEPDKSRPTPHGGGKPSAVPSSQTEQACSSAANAASAVVAKGGLAALLSLVDILLD